MTRDTHVTLQPHSSCLNHNNLILFLFCLPVHNLRMLVFLQKYILENLEYSKLFQTILMTFFFCGLLIPATHTP